MDTTKWTDVATTIAAAVAAIGTVGALFASGWQIRTARQQRREDEQAAREERRREQVNLIAAWIGEARESLSPLPSSPTTAIYLLNGSPEPAYNVVACVVFVQGAAPRTLEEQLGWWTSRSSEGLPAPSPPVAMLSLLPSGTWLVEIEGRHGSGIMAGRPGVDVAFTDRSGVHWLRRASGDIKELGLSPFEYAASLKFYPPYDLRTPVLAANASRAP